MKKTPLLLTTILALALLTACGDAPEPPPARAAEFEAPVYDDQWFDDGGYILPDSHVNVVRAIGITSETERGVVQGFDLDGRVSAPGDAETCQHGDLVDPEGREGIDNQLARMWPAIEPLVGEAVQGLLQGAINEGRILLMLELSGLDDLQNDEDVTFRVYNGLLDPDIGTLGLIAPDQTFYYDYSLPTSTVERAQIVDGELVAGPVALQIPINILDADFLLDMPESFVRITIRDDGTFEGILSGAFDVPSLLAELLATGAAAETRLIAPVFESNADMAFDGESCTRLSAAFTFEGTTAYVVRDPAQE